jgi:exopolyphosphatase/guanosine-5'-triphosphate,3'-diphosphate pyrophosphatase
MEQQVHPQKTAHHQIAPVLAAIDLGTNSCRLLVARIDNNGMKIIDSFSRVVRLGEGIQKTGLLSTVAIDRTIDALRICQSKIEHNQAQRVRAVTTEACRRARNSDLLLQRAQKELHINLEVISSAEEARLALTGCAAMLDSKFPYALTFDIGGGSTEVMWLKLNTHSSGKIYRRQLPAPQVLDWVSLPFGVVTTSEESSGQPITTATYESILERVYQSLSQFATRNYIKQFMEQDQVQMVGTSGTVTTLAAIQLNLERYDRRVIDGLFLETTDLQHVISNLLDMTYEERLQHPCIGTGRADLVVVGSAILQGIYRSCPVNRLRVADRGVREGILLELMRVLQRENPKVFSE